MNSRALLWGGAICVIVLVVAASVVPFVYVALAVAVLLLVALVVANRTREASDATREADNGESTSRLGTLGDDRDADPDYEPYDASTFDSAVFRPASRDTLHDDVQEPEQFEEFAEPESDWSTGDYGSTAFAPESDRLDGGRVEEYGGTAFAPETDRLNGGRVEEYGSTAFAPETDRLDGGRVDEYETTFEAAEYTTAFEGPGDTAEVVYEEYTGPSRDGASYEYESSTALDEPLLDESIMDDVDASSVLADEGILDESKVTTAETILAASQATRFEPETMSDEESNEETREILGRVAALLAKYE